MPAHMDGAVQTLMSCLSISIHVGVWSLILSLSLPIVCAVFSLRHVFPSLVQYVLCSCFPSPFLNLWFKYVSFSV